MKNIFLGLLTVLACSTNLWSQDTDALLINTHNRKTTSLNGAWHYIVDPYENGYYNYRYEPFDQQEQPSANAYFTNTKPKSPSDLIEYNFDEADTLQVPGDWNTQKEKLYYYEGTIWYKKSFDFLEMYYVPVVIKNDVNYIKIILVVILVFLKGMIKVVSKDLVGDLKPI